MRRVQKIIELAIDCAATASCSSRAEEMTLRQSGITSSVEILAWFADGCRPYPSALVPLLRPRTKMHFLPRTNGMARALDQLRQHVPLIWQQLLDGTALNHCRPGRIQDQRASDCEQVELLPLQALQQFVDSSDRGSFRTSKRLREFLIERDRAHGDGGLAGQLPAPSRQIQRTPLKLGSPEAAL